MFGIVKKWFSSLCAPAPKTAAAHRRSPLSAEAKAAPAADTLVVPELAGETAVLVAPEAPPWWIVPPRQRPVMPEFEAINTAEEFARLQEVIKSNDFKMIEISDNITQIIEMLNKPDMRYAEAAQVINRSPVLTGEFLKTVNSALYSRGQKISHLGVALSLLGIDNIKGMLYLYSSKHTFAEDKTLNDIASAIFEHSKAVALIAKYLSRRFYPKPDMAFLAGMLHDVGKIALLRQLGEDFEIPQIEGMRLTEDAFDEIFPNLHGPVGALLAKHWHLDDYLTLTIGHHHDYPDFEFPFENRHVFHLCALIEFSDYMARALGLGRFISDMDLFKLPSCQFLDIRPDKYTLEFLKPIPELLEKG